MRYSDFIKRTMANENDIDWNYYNTEIREGSVLQAKNSADFIRLYFKNGEKELALLLNPIDSKDFINNFIVAGRKESVLNFEFKERYSLPNDRAIHTVSGFFLGLLIENCLNGRNTLTIESLNYFPFSYLWYLTFLYHDYGYCVTEREDNRIPLPSHAPIPDMNFSRNPYRICQQEYAALVKMKSELGINISMFCSTPELQYNVNNSRQRNELNIERALLREVTQHAFTLQGRPKLRFNIGSEIADHQYSSSTTTRYFNYCINERGRVDHGIVGGYLFYDRMVKNYLAAYMKVLYEHQGEGTLNNFYFKERHFCAEQLPIFSYIADCISAHNIWKQTDESRALYELYRLNDLLSERFKNINFHENPLLYILIVADSIEPTKAYRNLPPQMVSEAVDINYAPGSGVLNISSTMNQVPIEILYQKAKELENWTSVRCSELVNGNFFMNI
jgi:hypothetical protein